MIDNGYASDLIVPINYTLMLGQTKTIGIFVIQYVLDHDLWADVIIYIEGNLIRVYTNNISLLVTHITISKCRNMKKWELRNGI